MSAMRTPATRMSDDPILDQAVKLRDGLLGAANEFRCRGALTKSAVTKELSELDAKTCEDAAKMHQKLGTEVTRLRLGIGHYKYGMLDRSDLIRMSESWNE